MPVLLRRNQSFFLNQWRQAAKSARVMQVLQQFSERSEPGHLSKNVVHCADAVHRTATPPAKLSVHRMKQLISKTAIKKPDGTRAVQRALTILGLFTEERCNWSLSELSRASGFDKATTLRLIRTLEAEAVLVPAGESGQYSMGPKVLRWAQAVGSATELKSAAVPLIDALWAETNETVTLAVLAGNFRVAILERQSPQPIRRVVEMYVPLPLHCGAAGKAILATFGADDLTAYFLRTRLIAYTTSTVVGQDELRYELRRVRRRGYATALQERIPDGAGIAAAVCGPSGKAVGAIAVSFPSHRFDRKSIARWSRGLTRAAAELTQFVS